MSEQSVFSRSTCCPSEPASTRQFAVLHAPICCTCRPTGSAPPHVTAALTSIQISACALSSGDQSPPARSAAHQNATIRTAPQRSPNVWSETLRARVFSLFTITKEPRVITQGENFTTEYFYRLIDGSESFTNLKKNALAPITSHRWLVCPPPFSPSEFEVKKASNLPCRCRRTEISLSTEQTYSAEGYLAKRQLSSDRRFRFQFLPLHLEVVKSHHNSAPS
jgi:hypothetical protein